MAEPLFEGLSLPQIRRPDAKLRAWVEENLGEAKEAPKMWGGAGAFGDSRMRSGLCLATILAASVVVAADTPLTIGQLLAQGWEIAGYASGYDNRTSLMLFRHQGVNALVQCGILYDVTRNPRTIINCYELK
jgi:hypothetical protein